MADRIGVINKGEIILIEEKKELMRKLGKKLLTLQLEEPLDHVPPELAAYNLSLSSDGSQLVYTYENDGERTTIISLLNALSEEGIQFKDIQTTQSSLENIFVNLIKDEQ